MEKYFEPKIEDFFVGYECEMLSPFDSKTWTTTQILSVKIIDSISDKIKSKIIRVPYLTKEQIENEGWNLIYKEDFIIFKNKLCCIFLFPNNYINIYNEHGVIFQGKIRCINEFRKLIKFLEIK